MAFSYFSFPFFSALLLSDTNFSVAGRIKSIGRPGDVADHSGGQLHIVARDIVSFECTSGVPSGSGLDNVDKRAAHRGAGVAEHIDVAASHEAVHFALVRLKSVDHFIRRALADAGHRTGEHSAKNRSGVSGRKRGDTTGGVLHGRPEIGRKWSDQECRFDGAFVDAGNIARNT